MVGCPHARPRQRRCEKMFVDPGMKRACNNKRPLNNTGGRRTNSLKPIPSTVNDNGLLNVCFANRSSQDGRTVETVGTKKSENTSKAENRIPVANLGIHSLNSLGLARKCESEQANAILRGGTVVKSHVVSPRSAANLNAKRSPTLKTTRILLTPSFLST